MNARLLMCLGAGLLISTAVTAADKINVKTGLWEMTTATEMSGMPEAARMPTMSPEMLAKLPPEQRARIEQAMKNMPGTGEHKTQSCVTDKDLERGLNPQEERPGQSCKRTIMKNMGSSYEMHIECSGEKTTGSGVMKMTMPNRETIDGNMDMNMVTNGHTMNMKMHIKGKWLSANCGNVKPSSAD